jgi:1,4-dihydroxy-2-naphthoate octaprenyltransferase
MQPMLYLLALIGALSLQIAANLINEYADHQRGTDTHKVAGMGMAIKEGLLSPQEIRMGAIITTLTGIVIGLFLVTQSGFLLLWIGVIGVLIVIVYTAGPFPLAYHGFGEIAVFIAMGPLMVLGTYYVTVYGVADNIHLLTPIVTALPIGCTIANILHANNLRDLEVDRAANKMTLAARFGRRFARTEYYFWTAGAYLSLLLLVAAGWIPFLCLITFATLPEARRLVETAYTTDDPWLLHILHGKTALFHRDFGIAMIVGWGAYVLIRSFFYSIG